MAVEVRKRNSENIGSLLFRFNKKVRQSGLLKEVRKRRFKSRKINRRKVRQAALYSLNRKKELARTRKYGLERKNK